MDRNRWNMNRAQRMQLKAFICLLGILLLVILLLGRFLLLLIHRDEEEEEPAPTPHIPVIEMFANVWIMEADEEGIMIFRDGVCESYSWGAAGEGEQDAAVPDLSVREQVADIVLTDGQVTSVTAMREKINGKILGADDSGIEVEGYGKLPLAADYKGYRLYDSLEMCTARDVFFGYNYTDLCIENGEVCGILMVKEEAMEYIRVLIKASDYEGLYHAQPTITCDVDYTVVYGAYDNLQQESHPAWEELTFGYDSEYFVEDRIWIVPSVLTGKVILQNCHRGQGTPAYRGQMELLRTEDGIVVIDEVLMEEYLYSVVPSEMPAGYPPEALKAQAICARTYAYGRMMHAGYPQYGAHADDSTSYQVYNNILESESTTTAVKETYGQLLFTEDGKLAETFYYSTSCGIGSDSNVWKTQAAPTLTYLKAKFLNRTAMAEELAAGSGTAGDVPDGGAQAAGGEAQDAPGERMRDEETFAAFISARNEDDFEVNEGWYRWSYEVEALDKEHMLEALQKRYAANSKLILTWKDGEYVSETIDGLEDITDLYIEKRGSGGIADELVIETENQKIKVISEHNIRYVLNDGATKVVRQDGSEIASPNLLPSGFFIIRTGIDNGNVIRYNLVGGGFGHGVGMSQNGARAMADSGYAAMEILLYFYENCVIENIYGQE
nr:SpoIID/LytB domain-containing protein [uncultured Acetatifactor sp.]